MDLADYKLRILSLASEFNEPRDYLFSPALEVQPPFCAEFARKELRLLFSFVFGLDPGGLVFGLNIPADVCNATDGCFLGQLVAVVLHEVHLEVRVVL